MWLPGPAVTPAGLLCLLLAAAAQDILVYKKVGDTVVLDPDAYLGPITNILWKHGPNIAAQWDGVDLDLYRQFKERGGLNVSSGEMSIRGLTPADSGLYTVEVNNIKGQPTHLKVIFPVPSPTVSSSCDQEEAVCTLSCDAATTADQQLTYRWTAGGAPLPGSEKEQRITKEESSSIDAFVCELENPVSQERSPPFPNPFLKTAATVDPAVERPSLKISTGVTVFICLLAPVVMLVLFHRCKAGMWFYQKVSMPWEADFWRKHERTPTQTVEYNGTTAHVAAGDSKAGTPMKLPPHGDLK